MPTIGPLALALMVALQTPPVAPQAAPRVPTPVDVFVSGESGHAAYRIPSIIRLADGMLLAFAEGRDSKADNGANDIVMRRSEDGGATWEPMQKIGRAHV